MWKKKMEYWSELKADGKDEKSEGGDDQSETDDESEDGDDKNEDDADEDNEEYDGQSEGGDDKSETSDESDTQSEMADVEKENVHEEDQVWKAIQVLKHIESLDGNYQGFVQHTNPRDIHIISQCCYNLLENNIPLPLSKKT